MPKRSKGSSSCQLGRERTGLEANPGKSTLTSFIYSKISSSIPAYIPSSEPNSCSGPIKSQDSLSI